MESYDLVVRQQQIAQEKAEKASALPRRYLYDWLAKECEAFVSRPAKKLVILPGLRGVGKTTLLLQLYHYLKTRIPSSRLFYLTLDEAANFNLTLSDLQGIIEKEILGNSIALEKKPLVFILDEIQYSAKWPLELKLLYDQGEHILTFATGSSALKLKESADIARRRILRPLYPLRFREYLRLHGMEIPAFDWERLFFHRDFAAVEAYWRKHSRYELANRLSDYLLYGGFPFKKEEAIEKTQDLITKIIHHDIEESIEDVDTSSVEKLVNYLALSKAGETSLEKMGSKLGISKPSLLKYLDYLEKAELAFSIRPFSESSAVIRKATKYYFASASIKAALLAKIRPTLTRSETMGELLETAVFTTLYSYLQEQNIAFQIFYDPYGCDFILQFGDGRKIAVEVKKGEQKTLQLEQTMKRIDADFGMIISSSPFRIAGAQICIPKELFLLM